MASVVQGGPGVNFTADHLQQCSRSIHKRLIRVFTHDVGNDYEFPAIPVGAVLSERELMAIASISAILKRSGVSAMEVSYAAIFVLHIALLNHLSLPQRRFDDIQSERTGFDKVVERIIGVSGHFLKSEYYRRAAAQLKSNIHDYVDGRLLKKLEGQIESGGFQRNSLPEAVLSDFARMAKAIEAVSGCSVSLPSQGRHSSSRETFPQPADTCTGLEVLPFSNPTFDVYLSRIQLTVDTSAAAEVDGRGGRRQEFTQPRKRIQREKKTTEIVPEYLKHKSPQWLMTRRRKREQLDFSRMTKYAASLVGAKGKMLEPIVITKNPMQLAVKKTKSKVTSKKEEIRAENSRKLSEKGDLTLQRMWKALYSDFHAMTDDEAKILKLDQFLANIGSTSSEKGCVVETEVRLCKIWVLQRIWAGFCRADARKDGYQVVAVIFDEAKKMLISKGLTNRVHEILRNLFQALGVTMPPRGSSSDAVLDSKLSFNTTWGGTSITDIGLRMTLTEFQLQCCGQYMDRDMDSKPDPRVSFEPDGWQRKVLDEIDKNNSVFVVAPTSAGKTFISFYAMEKV